MLEFGGKNVIFNVLIVDNIIVIVAMTIIVIITKISK